MTEPNQEPNAGRFNAQALNEALDEQRRARGMTWQPVAVEIGMSASTLTYTKKGGPDGGGWNAGDGSLAGTDGGRLYLGCCWQISMRPLLLPERNWIEWSVKLASGRIARSNGANAISEELPQKMQFVCNRILLHLI